MYAETDFLLALIKDDDWLGDAAESVYRDHRDDLWTSRLTLVELLLVAYREDRSAERTVANAAALVEVRGDVDGVVAAATYVDEHGFTPFDALHLVASGDDPIVSSDGAYEGFTPRLDLRDRAND
ncbi:PIN domain-containing protein [Halorubrum sp. GN11_10-6_MGM]|uniref:PIN domain-containing protein n=1 Tax=Halorubrum sp. GN11_10-6_MGM TaxID=2518112 RepID=UPI0010F7B80B|nr:PIN domain-containing protein [Halorubrum sp. GN11_10-6_MGM]TKX74243.1 PIN domain-containing protein [Halorubrum sp. GN11_10-6_MGM]